MLRNRLYLALSPLLLGLLGVVVLSLLLSAQALELSEIEAELRQGASLDAEALSEVLANHRRQIEWMTLWIGIGVLVCYACLMAFIWLVRKWMILPMGSLAEAAERVSQGDWTAQAKGDGIDEVRKLVAVFNRMLETVRMYRKNWDIQVMRSQTRLRQCLNNFPHPVVLARGETEILYSNIRADEVWRSQSWGKAVPPRLAQAAGELRKGRESRWSGSSREVMQLKVEDKDCFFLPELFLIEGEVEAESDYAIYLYDVTNLKLADSLKSDLIATVSHEIKTPLTGSTMALHLLREESLGPLNEPQREMLQTAIDDLNRIEHLANNFLQIGNLEAMGHVVNRKTVDCGKVALKAIEDYSERARMENVSLTVEVAKDTPMALADEPKLAAVVSNFVDNALKYAADGGEIRIYVQPEGRYTRIGVKDRGPGVPPDERELVFKKFYQGSEEQPNGVGLGLAICREIVNAHDGEIRCEGRKGGGSDFYMLIPQGGGRPS